MALKALQEREKASFQALSPKPEAYGAAISGKPFFQNVSVPNEDK
jgi:hypothetical protein